MLSMKLFFYFYMLRLCYLPIVIKNIQYSFQPNHKHKFITDRTIYGYILILIFQST